MKEAVFFIAFMTAIFGTGHYFSGYKVKNVTNSLIEACEKELPRNQHCKIEYKAVVVQ